MKVSEVLKKIQSDAENIQNDQPQRFPEAANCGDFVRQGDVYIWKIDKIPGSAKLSKKPKMQLAPGSTKGSRHCLDSLDGATLYTPSDEDPLQGPLMELAKERVVTHPEHGDWILPPGIYEITYQLAYAEVRRRVWD